MLEHSATEERPGARASRIPEGMRVYAIGDLHGRLDLLERLIGMIRADAAARPAAMVRIVLLGDLIDRGPDSAAIVDRCRMLSSQNDRFIVLKGNHEATMVHAMRGNVSAFALWMRSGGDAALRSWGVPDDILRDEPLLDVMTAARMAIPSSTIAWLDELPLTFEVGDYLFVHAGIRPGIPLDSQSPEDLLWIRNEFLDHPDDHAHIVVHGHSIDEAGAVYRSNRIGIDTGAYRTGVLTVLGVERDESWMLSTSAAAGESTPPRSLEWNIAAILGEPSEMLPGQPPPRPRLYATAARAGLIAATISLAAFAWFVIVPPERRSVPSFDEPIGRGASAGISGPAPTSPRAVATADPGDLGPGPLEPGQVDHQVRPAFDRPAAGSRTRATGEHDTSVIPGTAGRAPAPQGENGGEYVAVVPAITGPGSDRRSASASPDSSGSNDVRISAPTEAALAKPAELVPSASQGLPSSAPAQDARYAATTKNRLTKDLESMDAIKLLRRQ